ncbi:hypothetical protein VTI74DRAFT_2046 [Chaetomium olivicolor]
MNSDPDWLRCIASLVVGLQTGEAGRCEGAAGWGAFLNLFTLDQRPSQCAGALPCGTAFEEGSFGGVRQLLPGVFQAARVLEFLLVDSFLRVLFRRTAQRCLLSAELPAASRGPRCNPYQVFEFRKPSHSRSLCTTLSSICQSKTPQFPMIGFNPSLPPALP